MIGFKTDRRGALKVIATGVLTSVAIPLTGEPVQTILREVRVPPRFFEPHEYATVAALCELIIPADSRSPGARAAGVHRYIDRILGESAPAERELWRDGLAALDRSCQVRSGRMFVGATRGQQTALLREISRNERQPKEPLERFFRQAKLKTMDGYYTSEIGIHRELRYTGNRFQAEYRGCEHPEHRG